MKKIVIRFSYLSVLLYIGLALTSCSIKKNGLVLQNPSSTERKDELISLKRSVLEQKLGLIPANKFISAGRNEIQHFDSNKDGIWDEVNLLVSFSAKEKVELPISISSKDNSSEIVRAHVRHRRKNKDDSFGPLLTKDSIPAGQAGTDFTKSPLPPFLTEGPAWENDKVGFRIYFDVRNGKDIWGKTTSKMMMDTVGVNPKLNYHELADWGMDVLKVGASLGAGSLALSVPFNGKDTLVRLGGVNMGRVIFETVADGPLFGVLRLTYPKWKALPGVAPVKLSEEIKIWAGKYFYESNITVDNAPAGSKLVTGIVNLKSKTAQVLKNANSTVLYTYDKQSENNDNLGMALMVPNDNYLTHAATSNTKGDIRNTYTLTLNRLQSSTFRFYAAWSKSNPEFTTEANFRNFLLTESANYSSPIVLSWK